jgi:response regulator NasT
LVLTQNEEAALGFKRLFIQFGLNDFVACNNVASARRFMSEQEFDLCIINAPLPDEFGDTFATEISYESICQVILIVKEDKLEEIRARVEDAGVFTISKPFNKDMMWNVLKIATASYYKILRLKKSNNVLKQTIEDIKRTDRAKCCLIEFEKLSEEESHKYIERTAMNRRINKRIVVNEILSKYGKQ